MKLVLDAGQIDALRPWLEHKGILTADSEVGHVRIVTGAAGPRIDWVDAEGLSNEDFLDEGDWHTVQRLLKFSAPRDPGCE